MSKLTLNNVVNLQSETTAVTAINNNSDLIATALENTLSRDGTSPNFMLSDLDLNSFRVINLAAPVNPNDAVRLVDIGNITTEQLEQAHNDSITAASAAASATSSAASAAASAVTAASYIGAASSAAKWTTPRTISASTDATGSVSFDGSADFTLPLTLAASGVTAASYGTGTSVAQFSVDAKGRITAASNVAITSAPKWTAPITFNLTGAVTGTASVDGSGTVNLATTLSASAGIVNVARAVITVAGGVLTIRFNSGFSSITRTAAGHVQFQFTTPQVDAYYSVSSMTRRPITNSALTASYDYLIAPTNLGFTLATWENGAAATEDAARLDVLVTY